MMNRLPVVYAGLLLFCLLVWGAVYVAVGGPLPR
jgi:hypothetical protein